MFGEARKVAPAIIFMDQIDTIGRTRAGARFFEDTRARTDYQPDPHEMDGFSGHEGVIVLAATKRPMCWILSLLRLGPFNRTIVVHPPDMKAGPLYFASTPQRSPSV